MKGLSLIIREEISQEKYGLITITDCVVTTGLEQAKIYVSALKKNGQAAQELNRNKKMLIEELKHTVNLRKIPKLEFIADARAQRVEELEDLLNKE
jgi:ribosome-binding factor A